MELPKEVPKLVKPGDHIIYAPDGDKIMEVVEITTGNDGTPWVVLANPEHVKLRLDTNPNYSMDRSAIPCILISLKEATKYIKVVKKPN